MGYRFVDNDDDNGIRIIYERESKMNTPVDMKPHSLNHLSLIIDKDWYEYLITNHQWSRFINLKGK